MGLFHKPHSIQVLRRSADGSEVQLWSGRGYLYPFAADTRHKERVGLASNVNTSHRCYGVPQEIEVRRKDRLIWGARDMEILLPTQTFDGILGSAGWDLLLLEER